MKNQYIVLNCLGYVEAGRWEEEERGRWERRRDEGGKGGKREGGRKEKGGRKGRRE